MGGNINMAFRFSDGEAVCYDRWTNNVKANLSKPALLDGDEQVVRDYIAMTRNNDYVVDPSYLGLPVRLSTSGYGLILIDFVTKTIIDCNGYTRLFDDYSPLLMFDEPILPFPPKWSDNYYGYFRKFVESGRTLIRRDYAGGFEECYVGVAAHKQLVEDSKDRNFIMWGIDTAPWRYIIPNDDTKGKKIALKVAREIGFPFTRKEGLNRTVPHPKIKKNVDPLEIKARYLFAKLKSQESYKHLDGKPWESLTNDSKQVILEMAGNMTDKQLEENRLRDFLGATSMIISIGSNLNTA